MKTDIRKKTSHLAFFKIGADVNLGNGLFILILNEAKQKHERQNFTVKNYRSFQTAKRTITFHQ